MAVRRVVLVVLDSVGIGVQPEAERDPADAGSNTLANTARAVGGLALPNLARLGLGRLVDAPGLTPVSQPLGAFGRLTTRGPGKETLSGHWEMMGCIAPRPFRTFPHGFPPEVIRPFEAAAGRPVLGNRPASGTVIIEELGVEHMASGRPIVYTSADSVFQIAAHEEVVPLEELYRLCQAAREILQGDYLVGRVIARPFVGRPGGFQRTVNRRDFAVEPFTPTVLDHLADAGIPVHAIGKIWDIFSGRGISSHVHTQDNRDGMARTLEAMAERPEGLIFTNLVDFDSQFGHRNDPEGYARALREVDAWLPEWLAALRPGDVGILTADHGNDPTTPSTDHSREYVPALLFGPEVGAGVNLGTRPTLADLGRTVAEALGVQGPPVGESFWPCVAQR